MIGKALDEGEDKRVIGHMKESTETAQAGFTRLYQIARGEEAREAMRTIERGEGARDAGASEFCSY